MGSKEPIKTWARACTVIPEFIGYTFLIHDGRRHVKILMTEDMVGHKFGEFAPSRTFKGHGGGKGDGKGKSGGKSHGDAPSDGEDPAS